MTCCADHPETSACRGCDDDLNMTMIVCMGRMPLANALIDSPDADEIAHPLHLMVCSTCGLVQVAEAVDPDGLFGHVYPYHSSVNVPYVAQEHALVDRLVDEMALGPDDLVVEVGSNDGYLLSRYVERDVGVLGIDPAKNLAEIARDRGIWVRAEFMDEAVGSSIAGQARIVHANNVLAHVPDLDGVLSGIEHALAPDGVLIVETPYVGRLVAHHQYDTIYHEHLYYWSAIAFSRAVRRAGLAVIDAERIPSHCGSIRFTVTKQGVGVASDRLRTLLADERRRGMDQPEFYEAFARGVAGLQEEVRSTLRRLHLSGKRIAAYGAAAKGTILLNALGLGTEVIEYVIDSTPYKQGKYLPGVCIPIVAPDVLATDPPDVVLILAWNFAETIIEKHADYLLAGGTFIVPNPEPYAVTRNGIESP